MPQTFAQRSHLPFPAEVVFDYHARPGALARLTPPWQRIHVLDRTGSIRDGDRVRLRQHLPGLHLDWLVEHRDFIPGRQFRDLQLKGPFSYWQHTHTVEPDGPDACHYTDAIEYDLPLGAPGRYVGSAFVQRELERTFAYRHRLLRADLDAHRRIAGERRFTVALSGSHGLLGSALDAYLTAGGHQTRQLLRSAATADTHIRWDPQRGVLDEARLEGVDAVVHLAGENLFGLWTPARRHRIRDSRITGTRRLAESLAGLQRKPAVLLSASAVGFYGDRGDEILTETSPPGTGFLSEVCTAWEQATAPARAAGIRIIHLRLGVVLSPAGGALKAMLPPFLAGLGGRVGDGSQWMSWISLDDTLDAILTLIAHDDVQGPLNLVTPPGSGAKGASPPDHLPGAVRHGDFVQTLARVLHRPAKLALPAPVARLVPGRMAKEMLLASTRVAPARLAAMGFTPRHADLEAALRAMLGR